jgi:hypothetical protein
MGRFLSPDWSAKAEPVPYAKLDDPQSLDLYAYVRNNLLIRIDKDGHCDGTGFWCAAWNQLKTDINNLARTAQGTVEGGVGGKVDYKKVVHLGVSLHYEKSIPLLLSHKSGEIIPNAEPDTIKLEVDGGLHIPNTPIQFGGEAGIQIHKSDEGTIALDQLYAKPDGKVGGASTSEVL